MGRDASKQHGGSWWRGFMIGQAIPVVLPVVTLGATAFASTTEGFDRVYWYSIAGSAVLGAGLLAIGKDRETKEMRAQAVRAKTALAMALSGAGQPLVTALATVTAATKVEDARAALEVLQNRIVAVAQEECGRQTEVECHTRAVFYKFVGEDLVLEYCEGRHGDTPRERFSAIGTPHEREAIRVAHSPNGIVVDDLEQRPPPHFSDAGGRSYKSFIAVPVRAGGRSFGLLVADSDKPNTLSGVDKGYLVLLAGLLAAGLAHFENAERFDADRSQILSEDEEWPDDLDRPSLPPQRGEGAPFRSKSDLNGKEGT